MKKLSIMVPDLYDAAPYAHAVRIDEIVYTSCIEALDRNNRLIAPGDIVAQARQIYANLDRILQTAGAQWRDVAKVNHFFAPPGASTEEFDGLKTVMAEYLPLRQQAGTDICFGLAKAGSRLQVELIAHVGSEKRVLGSTVDHDGHGRAWAPGVKVGRHVYAGSRRAYGQGHGERGTLAAQTATIYGEFDTILKEAAIPWRDLVRVRQFITDTSVDFNHVREGRQSFVPAGRFTSTSVACDGSDPSGQAGRDWIIAVDMEAASGTKVSVNTNAMVDTPGVPHALKIGRLVHLQAEIANDDKDEIVFVGDIEGQARHVLQFMDKMLDAAGCGWSDVITSRIFCREREHLDIVRRIERNWAGTATYARSDLLCRFFHAEALLEIELTAHRR
ncbi:enamine deaminase RidA (YjgF/YER057c/UK114 family) [Rhodoligotrophos appendicifer]|uniref:RidA family protein n=1 Tax=Rhodoligotrophos appendicifer TaxID=987056 RepID=UPI001185EDFB|nr:RidA family protein [Rhodoligotrophos appendicifer]